MLDPWFDDRSEREEGCIGISPHYSMNWAAVGFTNQALTGVHPWVFNTIIKCHQLHEFYRGHW
jgi:hypothetical protein